MRVYIVRHAETEKADTDGAGLKHPDPALSIAGRSRSLRLCSSPLLRGVQTVTVSQYQRTFQSVESLAAQLKIVPRVDPRLNKIDFGTVARLSSDQIREQRPDIWSMFNECAKDVRFPEGETCREAQGRIVELVHELRFLENDALLVSHGGLIRTLLCHVAGLPAHRCFDFKVDSLGIMEIEWSPDRGKYMLIRFNQQAD